MVVGVLVVVCVVVVAVGTVAVLVVVLVVAAGGVVVALAVVLVVVLGVVVVVAAGGGAAGGGAALLGLRGRVACVWICRGGGGVRAAGRAGITARAEALGARDGIFLRVRCRTLTTAGWRMGAAVYAPVGGGVCRRM